MDELVNGMFNWIVQALPLLTCPQKQKIIGQIYGYFTFYGVQLIDSQYWYLFFCTP